MACQVVLDKIMAGSKKTFKIVALRELGRRIQYLRKDFLHLKQREFAKELNTAESTIQNWESGKLPSGEMLERNLNHIVRTFKIQKYEDWLKFGKGDPPKKDAASGMEIDIAIIQEIGDIIEGCYKSAGKELIPERKTYLIKIFYPPIKNGTLPIETLRALLPKLINLAS